jgi:hypothetical protein
LSPCLHTAIFYPAILSLSQKLDIHLSLHHSLSPNYASSSLSQPPSLALDEDESESDHLTSSSCSSSSTEAEEDDELLPEAGGKKNQAPKLRGAEKNRRKKEEQAKKGKEKGKGKGGGKAGKVARGLVGDRTPPEVAIMGVLVVLLKMMFGLDGRDRFVFLASILLSLARDWNSSSDPTFASNTVDYPSTTKIPPRP